MTLRSRFVVSGWTRGLPRAGRKLSLESKSRIRGILVAICLVMAGVPAGAQSVDAGAVFSQNCASCHGAQGLERAPRLAMLRLLEPKFVLATLTSGAMRIHRLRLNP